MEVAVIIVLAFVIGFLMGRNGRKSEKRDETNVVRICGGKSIASPVDGSVHFFCEGGQKVVVINPVQGKVYAPISGKITKLYPMGNAFCLRGDEGTELLIRVGNQHPDELCSMHFRTRVVENEIVNKGKLLMEFDREGLLAAGEEVGVMVCSVCSAEEEILVTEKEMVKIGEELFRIL